MFLFTRLNLINFIIIYLYYILLSIKIVLGNVFIDIKKLSLSDSYFVVLDSGLYLYNFNTLDCSIILSFNSTVYRSSNDKIILNELNGDYNSYILCLVNEYLFVFSEFTYKLVYNKIDDIITFNMDYYNIIPYQIENNNIRFITL